MLAHLARIGIQEVVAMVLWSAHKTLVYLKDHTLLIIMHNVLFWLLELLWQNDVASRLLLQGTLVLRKLILILILLNCIKWLLDDVPLAYFKKICLNLILRIRLQESLASLIYSLVGNYLHFLQLVLL